MVVNARFAKISPAACSRQSITNKSEKKEVLGSGTTGTGFVENLDLGTGFDGTGFPESSRKL